MKSSQIIYQEENASTAITGSISSEMRSEASDDPTKRLNWTVGVKFQPEDHTLARDYLARKVSGCTDGEIFPLIIEGDIYSYAPWELPSKVFDLCDKKMYFFSPIQKKFLGKNFDRTVPGGCWKKTEKPSDVIDENGNLLAIKNSLTFYENLKSGKAMKTQWLMKEFTLPESASDQQSKTIIALCVIYYHEKKRKAHENEIELNDNEKKQNSISADMVGGSSAAAAAASDFSSCKRSRRSSDLPGITSDYFFNSPEGHLVDPSSTVTIPAAPVTLEPGLPCWASSDGFSPSPFLELENNYFGDDFLTQDLGQYLDPIPDNFDTDLPSCRYDQFQSSLCDQTPSFIVVPTSIEITDSTAKDEAQQSF